MRLVPSPHPGGGEDQGKVDDDWGRGTKQIRGFMFQRLKLEQR